jgi:hypothetical protein
MLLRIIPLLAIVLTILAILTSAVWRPYHNDGLYAPAHQTRGFF